MLTESYSRNIILAMFILVIWMTTKILDNSKHHMWPCGHVYMMCGCITTHYNAVESMMVLFKLTYAKQRRTCTPEEFPFFVRTPKELTAFWGCGQQLYTYASPPNPRYCHSLSTCRAPVFSNTPITTFLTPCLNRFVWSHFCNLLVPVTSAFS